MKIKKTFQGNLPENTVVNTQSNSQTNTYSCNFINGLVADDAIEISLSGRYTYTSTSWQNHIINYNTTRQSTGSKLTRSGNGVKIGAGVSKVLCIGIAVDGVPSAAGAEHDTGFIVGSTRYGHTYESPSGYLDTHTIAEIVPVNQGDIIQHYQNTGGTPSITVYETSRFIVIALK